MFKSSAIGAKALIPNPALKRLEFLLGKWRTEGSHQTRVFDLNLTLTA